jgi:hypothetical protein
MEETVTGTGLERTASWAAPLSRSARWAAFVRAQSPAAPVLVASNVTVRVLHESLIPHR